MEHGGVLLSVCISQHAVGSVSLVHTSTIQTLQIQKVMMHCDQDLPSQISKQLVCVYVRMQINVCVL